MVRNRNNKLIGFVDIHTHGALGYDVVLAGVEGLKDLAYGLLRHGVVAFLPTIPASSIEDTQKALSDINEIMKDKNYIGAKVIGVHLEGPFIEEKYKGALDANHFIPASMENWNKLVGRYESIVKRITLDPLKEGVMEFIPYLVSKGISVSLGHTNASSDLVNQAIELGADSVTHIFNAMPSLHHRSPGPVGAALTNDKCHCELILDFLHVDPLAAKLVIKAKGPEMVAIVSDSGEAAGMPDGEYELAGKVFYVKNGEARLKEGNLASSTVFMDQELRNVLRLGYSLEDAQQMLAITPAKLVSFKHNEDYTILDEDMNVIEVIINGKQVYKK